MRKLMLGVVLVLLGLIIALNLPIYPGLAISQADYSDWMVQHVPEDKRVIDIAMLGAHDALASSISFTSDVDKASASSIQQGVVGSLIKGFSVRQSKTQVSNLTELLQKGVRYLDVRLSFHPNEQEWYSTHNYFSRPFNQDLAELGDFIADHPGEVIILDLQHIYGIDYANAQAELYQILELFRQVSLQDFLVETTVPLTDLTYGEITQDKTQAAILLLSKIETDDPRVFSYGESIRSAWPNSDDEAVVFDFLDQEAIIINQGEAKTGNQITNYEGMDARDGFRIMQAVLTMQMNPKGIGSAITHWSLLTRAESFNQELINQPEFRDWLKAMPIVMVDFSDSSEGDFYQRMMDLIIEENKNER